MNRAERRAEACLYMTKLIVATVVASVAYYYLALR